MNGDEDINLGDWMAGEDRIDGVRGSLGDDNLGKGTDYYDENSNVGIGGHGSNYAVDEDRVTEEQTEDVNSKDGERSVERATGSYTSYQDGDKTHNCAELDAVAKAFSCSKTPGTIRAAGSITYCKNGQHSDSDEDSIDVNLLM